MRLRQYGVKSTTTRTGATVRKGYKREDLFDAWSRYLSPPKSDDEAVGMARLERVTSVTEVTRDHGDHGVTLVTDVTDSMAGTPTICRVCSKPLDPELVAAGERTHPGCDPTWAKASALYDRER